MKNTFKYLLCLLLVFILFLFIRNIQKGFILDFLNFSNFTEETTKRYFELIWEITASTFAILIAVITFGYELIGNTSRRRKRFDIFNNWQVITYSALAVVIILLSFYSAFTIDNLRRPNDLTTAYFIGILFICFIFFMFIFTIWILSLSDTVKEVKKLIDKSKVLGGFEEVISDELIYYIQEHDRVAYSQNLLTHLTNRCLSLIGEAKDWQKNEILNSLIKVWEAGNLESIRVGEQQYFISIWSNIQTIFEYAAKNKSQLLDYNSLESFTRQQIEFLSVSNSIGGLVKGAKTLSLIYLEQLRHNCPHIDSDSDIDLQWEHINNFLWKLNQIQEAAIDLNSKHLFEAVNFQLSSILSNIKFDSNIKLDDYQESFITCEIYSIKTFYSLKALEKEMYSNSADAFRINFIEIADYIKSQKIFSKNILEKVEEFILTSQKNKFLDELITIKGLGGLGRVISMTYKNNKTIQDVFLNIIEIFHKLKIEIQKESNYIENKNYNQIKQELESLKSCIVNLRYKSKTRTIILRIDEILSTY